MTADYLSPPEPQLGAGALTARRAHLLEEIGRRGARTRPTTRSRRLVLAVAVLLVLGIVGTAVAVGVDLLTQQEEFHSRYPGGKFEPQPTGSFVYVTRGDDWALIAWKSTRGICLDYAVPGNGASGCGFPVLGSPPDRVFNQPPPEHVVGYLSTSLGADAPWAVAGPISANVASVRAELRDGRVLEAETYDAPPKLDTPLRFYLLRVDNDIARAPGRPATPVRALLAYGASGDLLERFAVPQLSGGRRP